MREIFPGVFFWTAEHSAIGASVSSYYVDSANVVIDPKLPHGGFPAVPGHPDAVVLTSGHHDRDARAFSDHFGVPIRALPQAAARLHGELQIASVAAGELVAPGIEILRIGVLCDDEGALLITTPTGAAVAIADGITHRDDGLGFFRDELLGEDPDAVKRGLKAAYANLLDRDFQHLLFAHGEPVLNIGKETLAAFVS
jgi:hypothetical protein